MAALVQAAHTFASRILSLGRMSLLLALGGFCRLGVEKLLIFPVLLTVLGDDAIGQFVWLLGWATMLGQFAAGGVGDALLRLHAVAKEKNGWADLLATGGVLTATASLISLSLGGAAYLIWGTGEGVQRTMLVAGLGLYLVLLATRTVLQSAFRVELQFGRMASVDFVAGAVLLLSIPAGIALGLTGLAIGYALSAAVALAVQLWLSRRLIRPRRLLDRQWIPQLLLLAPGFAVASASGIAFYQAGRIVLGFFADFKDVAVYFAAESVVALGLIPLNLVAGVIYSIIARKRSVREVRRAMVLQHAAASVLCGLGVAAGLYFGGHWVLRLLYRPVADTAWPVLQILIFGAAAKPLFFFTRGFVYRFCSFRRIMGYTIGGVAVMLALLLILVPTMGIRGAAWSVSIANVLLGAVWFGTYLKLFLIDNRPDSEVPLAEASTPAE